MDVNDRFLKFMELNNIQPKELADFLNVTKSAVSGIKTGKSILTTKQLILTANKYKNLNLRWLLTGEGEMNIGYGEVKSKIDIVEEYGGCKMCIEKDKRIKEIELHRDDLRKQVKGLEDLAETLKKQNCA